MCRSNRRERSERLDADETKSGDPRNFPLYAELLAVLKAQERRRRAIENKTGTKEAAEKYAAHMETQRPTQKVINLR